MSEKVSIIIPVYKSERYIDDLLNDLHKQTYRNIEMIVINDGSPDNSQSIIDEWVKKDDRIISIVSQNMLVSQARNQGLDRATGEYIRFCDADDRVPANSIELLVNAMNLRQDTDLVIGSFEQVPDKNLYKGEGLNEYCSVEDMAKDFVRRFRSFYYGVVWNKLYKKEIIDANSFRFDREIIWSEDLLFNLNYYSVCHKIHRLSPQQIIYYYIGHEESVMNNFLSIDVKIRNKTERIRYQNAEKFFGTYHLMAEFDEEWKYGNISAEVYNLIEEPIKGIKGLWQLYLRYRDIVKNKELVKYVEEKKRQGIDYAFLNEVIYLSKHHLSFVIFFHRWMKQNVFSKLNSLQKLWRKIRKKKRPQLY